MRKNYININTDNLESLAANLGKVSNEVINDCDDSMSECKNIKDSGLMNNSSQKLFNQMRAMSDIFVIGKTMILKSVEKMVDTELFLNSSAEKIIVPKLTLINSSSFNEEVNNVYLTKNDGISVNSGAGTTEQNLNFNNVIKYNQKLNSIVKNYEIENGALEFNYNKKDVLIDINNDNVIFENTIDTNTNIKRVSDGDIEFYNDKTLINEVEG